MKTSRILRPLFSYGITGALLLQALGFAAIPGIAKAAEPGLIINEINWGGSSTTAKDQWIEVYNAGEDYNFATNPTRIEMKVADPATYAGCQNSETVVSSRGYCILGTVSEGVLPAGKLAVVGRLSAASSSVNLSSLTDYYVPESFSAELLKDTDYAIVDSSSDTVIEKVPEAAIAGKGVLGSISATAASIERVQADPTDPASWKTSATFGATFKQVGRQYGTPGAANVEVAVPKVTALTKGSDVVAPTLTGTVAAPATKVVVTVRQELDRTHDYVSQSVVATEGGAFSYPLAGLAPGRYTFTVQAVDAAGNASRITTVPVGPQPSENGNQFVLFSTASEVAQPVVAATPKYTNKPGSTFTGMVTAEALPATAEVDVLRNGVFVGKAMIVNGAFTYAADLTFNAANEFAFVTVIPQFTAEDPDALPLVSVPAMRTIVNDSIVPSALDAAKVTVEENAPGTADRIIGAVGAVKNAPDKLAPIWINFYSDAALTKQIGQPVAVNADGSFAAVSLGDNQYSDIYAYVYDEAGNSTKDELQGVSHFVNTLGPVIPAGGIGLAVTTVTQTQAKITWKPVTGASNYYIRYRTADGTYGSPILVCPVSTASCSPEATLINLTPGTGYVVAVAIVDRYGNVGAYQELTFSTLMPVAATVTETVTTATTAAPAAETKTTPRRTTRIQPAPVAAAASPTPEATATPEAGDVKSASTEESSTNWTPWIILGVLVGIAALASLGYFYWFGGEAGAAALASVEGAKKKEEESKNGNDSGDSNKKPDNSKKRNDRRW